MSNFSPEHSEGYSNSLSKHLKNGIARVAEVIRGKQDLTASEDIVQCDPSMQVWRERLAQKWLVKLWTEHEFLENTAGAVQILTKFQQELVRVGLNPLVAAFDPELPQRVGIDIRTTQATINSGTLILRARIIGLVTLERQEFIEQEAMRVARPRLEKILARKEEGELVQEGARQMLKRINAALGDEGDLSEGDPARQLPPSSK